MLKFYVVECSFKLLPLKLKSRPLLHHYHFLSNCYVSSYIVVVIVVYSPYSNVSLNGGKIRRLPAICVHTR